MATSIIRSSRASGSLNAACCNCRVYVQALATWKGLEIIKASLLWTCKQEEHATYPLSLSLYITPFMFYLFLLPLQPATWLTCLLLFSFSPSSFTLTCSSHSPTLGFMTSLYSIPLTTSALCDSFDSSRVALLQVLWVVLNKFAFAFAFIVFIWHLLKKLLQICHKYFWWRSRPQEF